MVDALAQLKEIDADVRELEEHHNEVLDVGADTKQRLSELTEEVYNEIERLQVRVDELRGQIQQRLSQAKRVTVILSLLAQQETLAPLKNRVDQQPYEFYATKEWFTKQLSERRESRE